VVAGGDRPTLIAEVGWSLPVMGAAGPLLQAAPLVTAQAAGQGPEI